MAEDRNPRVGIPILLFTIILIGLYYNFTRAADPLAFTLFVLVIIGMMGFIYLLMSYSGEKESKLYGLKPLIDKIPAVKRPEGHVHFRTKMMWTLGILVFYFVMTNVMMYGLEQSIDIFSEFRAIMAGANGSLMHLGIGPIVTGSIIMQLFTGAKIIKLDLTNEEDKAIYQGTQKVVVLMMIVIEAVPQVYGYLVPHASFIDAIGDTPARLTIVVQLIVGSYLVFLMDEVVSKWGIGSGISMFIAAGVSEAIFTGTVNWMPTSASENIYPGSPSGTFPKTVLLVQKMSIGEIAGGGWEAIFIREPNPILALVGTIVIFLVVAYAESSRIELPLAHGRVRGARGRYPIRLIYASNIPVILMAALLANINMFSLLLWNHPSLSKIPLIGHKWWIGAFKPGETQPYMGGAWYLSRPNGVGDWLLPLMNWDRYGGFVTGHNYYQVLAHCLVYLGVMIIGSILFAKFWIETTNMGPEAVAKQIQSSGMQIPGFRRDPRVLRKVLDRYIPVVTIISGAFVGALAGLADMIGTVGQTSGTGVLLAVGIIIRLYEEIGKEQMMEMHPVLRGFFGGD
ncbi:MAG: preprotein translocase subunit SecY [Thermoplasmata archaeon]|nr:MAG: preprotein translocase subunit SecY [Thermoplasmata archaeon]